MNVRMPGPKLFLDELDLAQAALHSLGSSRLNASEMTGSPRLQFRPEFLHSVVEDFDRLLRQPFLNCGISLQGIHSGGDLVEKPGIAAFRSFPLRRCSGADLLQVFEAPAELLFQAATARRS